MKIAPNAKNEERYIPGFEGRYVVGSLGYVRKVGSKKRNFGTWNNRHFKQVHITDNSGKERMFVMSRLVASVFIPNPDGRTQVDHIDTDRANNRVENLRWAWPRENMANHRTRVHLREPGLFRRRNEKQAVRAIFPDGTETVYTTMQQAASKLGCAPCTVSRCVHGDQPYLRGNIKLIPVHGGEQLKLDLCDE